MPRVLSLDLDDTLWPIAPVIEAAEAELHAWFEARLPVVAATWPPLAMRELRARIAQHCPEIAHDFSAQRRLSLSHALRSCEEDEGHVDEAFDVFFRARNRVCCYEDVPEALVRLSAMFPLASLSNGNADLERTGLGPHFSIRVAAREAGALKPDPRIFALLCERAGCPPERILHAGDDPLLDVGGARDAGLRAAWINRERRPWPGPGPEPDLVFEDLAALADWCEQVRVRSSKQWE